MCELSWLWREEAGKVPYRLSATSYRTANSSAKTSNSMAAAVRVSAGVDRLWCAIRGRRKQASDRARNTEQHSSMSRKELKVGLAKVCTTAWDSTLHREVNGREVKWRTIKKFTSIYHSPVLQKICKKDITEKYTIADYHEKAAKMHKQEEPKSFLVSITGQISSLWGERGGGFGDGLVVTKKRKLPPARKQWRPQGGCCNDGSFIRTGRLNKKKSTTWHRRLLSIPTGFGESLGKLCGALWHVKSRPRHQQEA